MMYNTVVRLTLFGLILLKVSCNKYFTDMWAVEIEGGERVARETADKHGFVFAGTIMTDFYHFHHRRVAKRSIYPSPSHHATLSQEPHVKWLEQQVSKSRRKRDYVQDSNLNQHRVKRDRNLFNDPKWSSMWYLKRGSGLDMNVKPAWRKGFTGRNVVVSILDDGIEKDHPDLIKNYDPLASYDVNENDADPMPRYDTNNENRHGTRCAGEVAAQANNKYCSVGVAYDARIGGVRMLDGDVTDAVEAHSLSYSPQHIDIYSASWGPDDDGRTVDGPAILARKAFQHGITRGRRGKGSIFVWASGNGGREDDSCNCDGYTNSIYTLSISSTTEHGNIPWYSEACSSTLATTYSSGSGVERQIVTTDLRHQCTESHTGTSASAPLAAGICALTLQANPNLSWRDMQHIVVKTARPSNLKAGDWITNGVGRKVSHSFGYGLMDAAAMTDIARNWTNVPPQHVCEIPYKAGSRNIPVNDRISVSVSSDGCQQQPNHVAYVEHVQALITLSASRRGEVSLYLTSPMGTTSTLLARRSKDVSHEGFHEWAFMTTHNWGETAKGTWTLEIQNGGSTSELHGWTLVTYGTASHPASGQGGTHTTYPGFIINANCSGVTAGGVCIECNNGRHLLDKSCYEECPPNFYESTINFTLNSTEVAVSTCQQCDLACRRCDPENVTHCNACNHGYLLYPPNCVLQAIAQTENVTLWVAMSVIVFVGASVLVFLSVFLTLQAKHHGWCCFPKKQTILQREMRVHFNGIKDEINEEAGVSLLTDSSDEFDSDTLRI